MSDESTKPELTERMNEVAHGALDFLESSASFVAEQAPIVVQEFLLWRTIWHGGLALLMLVLVPCCLFVSRKCYLVLKSECENPTGKKWLDGDVWMHEGKSLTAGGLGLASLVGLGFSASWFVIHAFTTVKILVAPRVYLIEEVGKWIG